MLFTPVSPFEYALVVLPLELGEDPATEEDPKGEEELMGLTEEEKRLEHAGDLLVHGQIECGGLGERDSKLRRTVRSEGT